MSFVEHAERTAHPGGHIPQRHTVRVPALVTGVGPALLPLFIHDVSRRGMYIAFQNHAAAIDEKWVSIGAAIAVTFNATIDGIRRPVKVQAQIRRRDEHGIGVRLVGCDEPVMAALRSLVLDAMAKRGERASIPTEAVAPPDPAPENNPETALADCEALLQIHGPKVIGAYMAGIEASLWHAKFAAPLSAQRRIQSAIERFSKARPQIELDTQAKLASIFGEYHRGNSVHAPDHASAETGGLSLVQSSELRGSIAIAAAAERIGSLLAGNWFELAQRLSQATLASPEEGPIAPGAVCFLLRDALAENRRLGIRNQVDLTAGFTDGFVSRLDALYGEMNAALERHGLRAAPAKAVARSKNTGLSR